MQFRPDSDRAARMRVPHRSRQTAIRKTCVARMLDACGVRRGDVSSQRGGGGGGEPGGGGGMTAVAGRGAGAVV